MEILLRLISVLHRIFRYILGPLFYILSTTDVTLSGTKLQKIGNSLNLESATKLAEKIRNGEVRSEDAVGAFGFRTRRMNAFLNAVVEDRYVKADEEAYAVDQMVASGIKSPEELAKEKPLFGVPVTIAQACKVEGMSYNVGCVLREGRKADRDGKAVALLRKAGAIPLVISNQSELCIGPETHNLLSGRTINPYCRQSSVGGASGGEAALISSGASVIGLGTDFAGSIQIPAMFTGIFGHKPTPGVISAEGHYGETSDEENNKILGVGFLARYAEDLPLLMSVLAEDKGSLLKLEKPVNMKHVRVLFIDQPSKSLGLPRINKEIKEIMQKAANYLANSCGCQSQMMRFKEMKNIPEIASSILFSKKGIPDIFSEVDIENPKVRPNLIVEFLKSLVGLSRHSTGALGFTILKVTNCTITESKAKEYVKEGEVLKKNILECLGDDGVLLFPTFPTTAHYHRESIFQTLSFSYSALISALGLPATHVPMGLNKKGLPIGIQVVAAPYQDRLCFAVAKELENGFGGWVPPPSL
ncbi:fatty-acid amide hydrolase 2-B-like isoform X2 [Lycorma delicatula]|uniref:fatty-acid amide hydrolase 2-B-like isoform X2 n=1 Tax=Lycorma delicatula TaxID=130591 RepID=UPI003F512F94